MEINKTIIESLISEFEKDKDLHVIKPSSLCKFNNFRKEDLEFLSYINGKGGYYIKFLNFIIKKLKPKTIVELGNREGLSTLSIFDAAEEYQPEFYTIDIEHDQRYCPQEMFTDAHTHFLFGDVCSYDIIKNMPNKIDFLFSDTIHFNFQIQDEFEIYQHLLSDKALVAIDDIHTNDKGVFFDKIKYEKWDLTKLCHQSGWGLFLFERKLNSNTNTKKEDLYESMIKVWERKYQAILNQPKHHSLSFKLKQTLKKITPAYHVYTKIYNEINQKIRDRSNKK